MRQKLRPKMMHETKQSHPARILGNTCSRIWSKNGRRSTKASSINNREIFGWGILIPHRSRGISTETWPCWCQLIRWILVDKPSNSARRISYWHYWNWTVVVSSLDFIVLIFGNWKGCKPFVRCSTQAFPWSSLCRYNVFYKHMHKQNFLKSTQCSVFWLTTSNENYITFKSHKAWTDFDKDRAHEITSCFGSVYLHWWMFGEKLSWIPRRMEYFLSRMWRRWRWLRRYKASK